MEHQVLYWFCVGMDSTHIRFSYSENREFIIMIYLHLRTHAICSIPYISIIVYGFINSLACKTRTILNEKSPEGNWSLVRVETKCLEKVATLKIIPYISSLVSLISNIIYDFKNNADISNSIGVVSCKYLYLTGKTDSHYKTYINGPLYWTVTNEI